MIEIRVTTTHQLSEGAWDNAALWGMLPYVDGFPDFSLLDDTDATRDEDGLTLRDRKMRDYHDSLDRFRE